MTDKDVSAIKVPNDPYRAITKLISKLDEEDKDTFNWIVRARDELLLTKPLTVSATGPDSQANCIAQLKEALNREQNAHAELQARCYDNGWPTGWSVFDELEKLEKEIGALRQSSPAVKDGYGLPSAATEIPNKFLKDGETLEALAAIEHEQWMEWANALMQRETLSEERCNRWLSLMVPYSHLPESSKDEDRKWARKVIEAARQTPNDKLSSLSVYSALAPDFGSTSCMFGCRGKGVQGEQRTNGPCRCLNGISRDTQIYFEKLHRSSSGYLGADVSNTDDLRTICERRIAYKKERDKVGESQPLPVGNGWISVKDRLPEESGPYLVYVIGHKRGNLGSFYANPKPRWSWRDDLVTHWMPLPSPPAEPT